MSNMDQCLAELIDFLLLSFQYNSCVEDESLCFLLHSLSLVICYNIYFKCHCVSTALFTLCKLCIYYVVLFR